LTLKIFRRKIFKVDVHASRTAACFSFRRLKGAWLVGIKRDSPSGLGFATSYARPKQSLDAASQRQRNPFSASVANRNSRTSLLKIIRRKIFKVDVHASCTAACFSFRRLRGAWIEWMRKERDSNPRYLLRGMRP
jgi:hypothetical protein